MIIIKTIKLLVITISFFISLTLQAQNQPDDIVGIWLTPKNLSAIQIYKKDNCYVGKIVWAKEPNDEFGNPKKDDNNPDPNIRHKPLVGLNIMNGLCYDNKEWVKGHIYNPESGNTYKIKVELIEKNTLNVRGYIGVSLIGKTSVWKRRPTN